MAFDIFLKNGEIKPMTDAVMPVSNIEYAYGFGVYENIRVVRGRPLFQADHAERLMRSARVIGLDHDLTAEKVTAWTEMLIKACPADALNLKMLLIGGREAKDAQLFILPLAPLFPDKRLYSKGATAITAIYERQFPDAKTLNMLGSYLAYRKAKKANAYDALLVNNSGCITEGTRTNFFAIKGKTLISPPMEEILEGVTLKHVIEVAKKNGYSVQFEPIPLASIGSCDGAFLTSTSSKIMPLCKIDEVELIVSEALKTLIRHFDDYLATHSR